MTNEEAKILRDGFESFCNRHNIKSAAAYLASTKDNSALMAYHNIDDNELCHVAASIIMHLSAKYNATPQEIIKTLEDGINENYANNSILKN